MYRVFFLKNILTYGPIIGGQVTAAGDLGPEGIIFIAPEDSPTAQPLVVVGNEVSGTTTAYRVKFSKKNKKK